MSNFISEGFLPIKGFCFGVRVSTYINFYQLVVIHNIDFLFLICIILLSFMIEKVCNILELYLTITAGKILFQAQLIKYEIQNAIP